MLPEVFTPMLATLVDNPFDSPDFLFEVKWDGVRSLAFCQRDRTTLYARSGREISHQYPEFSSLHSRIRAPSAVFDGEIIAMSPAGRPSFELLQQRIGLTRPADVTRASQQIPVELVLFDVVWLDDEWIGDRPLSERLIILQDAVEFGDGVLPSSVIPESGVALFDAARERGLEGIVAKKASSLYHPGRRTRDWLKIKVVNRLSCVIGGWKLGAGSRSSSFGALLVGLYDGKVLRYIGSVGTGFTDATLKKMMPLLTSLQSDECPFEPRPALKHVRWVEPAAVCDVEYREITAGFKLRAPSFKGLRDDIEPSECTVGQQEVGGTS